MNIQLPWDPDNSRPWEGDGVEPSDILDLQDWKVTLPVDGDDPDSKPDEVKENALSDNYESPYFYASSDGGVVFNVPSSTGNTATTTNSNNPRTELREMLRRGDTSIPTSPRSGLPSNENNWVFGSATRNPDHPAGGVNGELTATLSVNRVAEFSQNDNNLARVVIGQIHAGVIGEGGGEVPLLIIYRKLPNEDKGTIYLQPEDSDNQDFGRYDLFLDSGNASDGIALGEQFSYNIKTEGNDVTVTLSRDGKPDLTHTIDYEGKGYDAPDQFLYFRAGAYVQNNSVTEGDYTQVTFYQLDNTHDSPDEIAGISEPNLIFSETTSREALVGTENVDVFTFNSVENSLESGVQDYIGNFELGKDKIDLSGVGITGLDTDGGQTEAGEIRLAYSANSNRTYLRSDQSEFEAFLKDGDYTSSLNPDDFIFANVTDNTDGSTDQPTGSERLYSQETSRETLTGALGVETRYDFDDAPNSTDDGRQDVIRNFEPGLDIIDLSDLGIIGLDTDGGQTEIGEIRLAYSGNSDRTYLRSDQSEFEAFLEGDFRNLTEDSFIFSENINNII